MKKFLSALVALFIFAQLSIPVLAADDVKTDGAGQSVAEQEQQLQQEANKIEVANEVQANRVSLQNNALNGTSALNETKTINQALASAPIATNQLVPVQLTSSVTQAYYTFTVKQGYISFTIENTPAMGAKFGYKIFSGTEANQYDQNSIVLWESGIPSALGSYTSAKTGIAPGTYTVRIEVVASDANLRNSLSPRFKINETNTSNWETEPNSNSLKAQNAAKLTFGKPTYAAMNSANDRLDWFRVDVKTQGVLRVSLSSDKVAGETWNYTLFDASAAKSTTGATLLQNNDVSADKTSIILPPTGVKKGTYYIRFYLTHNKDASYNVNYRPRADFDSTKTWEIEGANNTAKGAAVTSVNSVKYGNFRGYGDQDWYKIRIPKAGKYTFNYTNTNGADKKGSYYMGLYSNLADATKVYSKNIAFIGWKKAAKESRSFNLKAGTYYIYMSGYQNVAKNASYSLSITSGSSDVKSITLSPAKAQTLKLKKSVTIKVASVNPSNISKSNAYWTSSNTNVVVVSQSGKVTAVGKGSAVVSCRIGGTTKTIKFKVA